MTDVKRFSHKLKVTGRKRLPHCIILFDTETWVRRMPEVGTEQTFRLGWAAAWYPKLKDGSSKTEWRYLEKPEDLWFFLEQNVLAGKLTALTSLNLIFDLTVCGGFKYLGISSNWILQFVNHKNNVFLGRFQNGKCGLMLFDILSLFRCSVAELGEHLGVPKGKVDFDNVTDEKLAGYCRRDVEIILAALQGYVNFTTENDLGGWAWTIGSQAFQTYRHRFMRHDIYLHTSQGALQLERGSYRGGRTEAFWVGQPPGEHFWKLDVNSMYAYVMRDRMYPTALRGVMDGLELAELKKLSDKYCVIAEVILDTPEPVYGIIAKHKLLFPTGRFGALLTTPEIKYALRSGHVKRIGMACVYHKAKLFADYVNVLYGLRNVFREQHNPLYVHLTKYLLATLHGKWGQLAENWTDVEIGDDVPDGIYEMFDHQTQRTVIQRKLFGLCQEYTGDLESRESFTAISSHITAEARMHLWSLIVTAGRENVFYTDTDSLIVNKAGLVNLKADIHKARLGALKVEYGSRKLDIVSPKHYTTDVETHIKGIPANAEKLDDSSWRIEQWPGVTAILRSGQTDTYKTIYIIKRLTQAYDKGQVLKSGQVIPFEFWDDGYPVAVDSLGRLDSPLGLSSELLHLPSAVPENEPESDDLSLPFV